jgi:glycosyltransferase involved in cell wall biosynthesis
MFNVQTVRELSRQHTVSVRVLVPEWRFWRWSAIRRWLLPEGGIDVVYLPVFYLPWIGRSLSHLTYRWSLPQGRARMLRAADGDTPSLPKAHARRCTFRRGPTLSETIKGYDAVLVPWLYPDGAAVAGIACRLGKPVWLMALGTDTFHLDSGRRRRAVLKACARAQGIICVCRLLADRLATAGVPREKLHVVPNGVDSSLFRYRNKEELLGCQAAKLLRGQEDGRNGLNNLTTGQLSNSQLVLFVGNLVPVKGPDVMLRAFAALGKNEVQVAADVPAADGQSNREVVRRDVERHLEVTLPQLLLIGSGPMRAQLERLARDLNIAERVHFLGNRPHEEVALWMNAADVLGLTSRSEGMPNVVIEALASGLPVVATDVGACRELLEEEPAARVCQPDDEAGFAIAIGELLGAPCDRRAMSDRHAKRFSWRSQADTIAELMEHE